MISKLGYPTIWCDVTIYDVGICDVTKDTLRISLSASLYSLYGCELEYNLQYSQMYWLCHILVVIIAINNV